MTVNLLSEGLDTAGRINVIRTTEQLRLGYDETHFVSFTVDSLGGLVITTQAGEPVVVPDLVAAGKSVLSRQTRIGDLHRVEAISVPDTSGLTGAGVESFYDAQEDRATIRSWDYTGAGSAKPLDLVASELIASIPDFEIFGKLTVVRSTGGPQVQFGYDAPNNVTITVSSTGVVTFTAAGSAPKYVFDKSVVLGTDPMPAGAAKLRVGEGVITAPVASQVWQALFAGPNTNSGHTVAVVSDGVGRAALFMSQGYSQGVSGSSFVFETDGTTSLIRAFINGTSADGPLKIGASALTLGLTDQAVGFYGVAPTARQLLATGAGRVVDDVITFLQTLGLARQS
jgi:hypothetical protein